MSTDKIDFRKTNVEILDHVEFINGNYDQTFDCSHLDYIQYYNYDAPYDKQENLAITYLLKLNDKVLGFVSIAMAHLRKENTDEMNAKGTSGNIPALLISHLATHKEFVRKGVGTRLVDLALEQAIQASEKIGCRYLMLNPENDEGVRAFYTEYGFEYLPSLVDDKTKDAFILDILQEKKP